MISDFRFPSPGSTPPVHVSSREEDPRAADMTPSDVSAIWGSAWKLHATGVYPALALCIRRHGRVVLDRAIGWAHGARPADEPGVARVAATADTPFCLFSASKAITAMVIHGLDGEGRIRLDDPVDEYIPEFGKHGKDRITIRHVLTHRAGLPSIAGDHNDPSLLLDWDRVVRLLCEARPALAPGRRLAYHAVTGGFILGEIVRRVTGQTIREVLHARIQRPLGMRWFNFGVAAADVPHVATNYTTGSPPPIGAAQLARRALGVSFEDAVRISNGLPFLTSIVPAGNLVATAGELALFFDVLLHDGTVNGVTIFDRRTVRRALTESSYLELDLTLALPVRYGLGLMLGAPMFSPFGPHTSRAYGHYGFTNVIGWADPARRISVGLLTSGKPLLGTHLPVLWGLLRTISERCATSGTH